jgi:hypothetical protein
MKNRHNRESWVQKRIELYLEDLGYKIVSKSKGKSHGVDIKALHPTNRRYYFVEVKSVPQGKSKHAMTENYFLNALGEILLRMTQDYGNYALGLPSKFLKKINKIPKRVLKVLNLKFLLVDYKGNVKELSYKNVGVDKIR